MSFGRYLRRLRREAGLTMQEAADRSELSQSYLSRLENEQAPPPSDAALARLADALDLAPNARVALRAQAHPVAISARAIRTVLVRHPAVAELLWRLVDDELTDEETAALMAMAQRRTGSQPCPRRQRERDDGRAHGTQVMRPADSADEDEMDISGTSAGDALTPSGDAL